MDRRPIQERRGQVESLGQGLGTQTNLSGQVGGRECSVVERNNLVAVAALVVRAVVEASLRSVHPTWNTLCKHPIHVEGLVGS